MRKKLFAILMSAMMMVTFMPAMAFAATISVDHKDCLSNAGYAIENVKFDLVNHTAEADVVCATSGCTHVYKHIATATTATWNKVSAATTAVADFTTDLGEYKNDLRYAVLPEGVEMVQEHNYEFKTSYVDMTGAMIVKDTAGTVATTVDADAYLGFSVTEANSAKKFLGYFATGTDTHDYSVNPLGGFVKFVQPAYTTGYNATTPDFAALPFACLDQMDVKVAKTDYEPYADADLTLAVNIAAKTNYTDRFVGTPVASQTIKVTTNKGITTLANVKAKLAAEDDDAAVALQTSPQYSSTRLNGWNQFAGKYTGADLGFTVLSKGVKIEYADAFDADGKAIAEKKLVWTTTAPVCKDAAAGYNFYVKVTIEKTPATNNISKVFPVHVAVLGKEAKFRFAQEEFVFNEGYTATKAELVEAKGFLDADKEMAAKYMEKYVEVKHIISKVGTSKLELEVKYPTEKELAADKALAQFCMNYDIEKGGNDKATMRIVEGRNDVTAVNQTKSYHNKSGKLAKTYTFQLKGDVADWGTITYVKKSGNAKITVAADGTVTVKKGLKKGTYTVKIKVKAPGASDIKTLKVIVKK